MMNKQELLKWVESLPEDAEALPIEVTEIEDVRDEWRHQPGLMGSTFPTVYEQKVHTKMTLRLQFTGAVRGEFKRDLFGNQQWANVRRVK